MIPRLFVGITKCLVIVSLTKPNKRVGCEFSQFRVDISSSQAKLGRDTPAARFTYYGCILSFDCIRRMTPMYVEPG